MGNAAKIVSSAILGLDCKAVVINSKVYVIMPPTIKKIAGAGLCLSNINGKTIKDIVMSADMEAASRPLSYFIQGDDLLSTEISQGTHEEVVGALCEAYSLIGTKDFLKLSDLARNVANLIAKQRP